MAGSGIGDVPLEGRLHKIVLRPSPKLVNAVVLPCAKAYVGIEYVW